MANRYWVGGTGNWSDATNHWSDSSNGTPNASFLPTSSDNVYFDANSGSGTVTINATANCLDLTFTSSSITTFTQSSTFYIYGSLTLESGITWNGTSTTQMVSTSSGKTITTAGVTLYGNIRFNGSGGEWTLQDNITFNTGKGIEVYNGSFISNDKTITAGLFSSGSGTKSISLGSSVLNIGSNWSGAVFNLVSTGLTFNAGTSTINLLGYGNDFYGGGLTYYNVSFNSFTSNGTNDILGANTFNNLTYEGYSGKTGYLRLNANQTVNGTFTVTGNSATNRILVNSNTLGTARTITANAVSLTNVDFQDITGAGSATWSGTSVGNALGNSGITFTTPVTRYWVATSGGNWSATTSWSDSSGGSSGSSVPLCHDTVVFDSNSISSASKTITADMPRVPALDFSNVANSPTLSLSNAIDVYGSLNMSGIGVLTTNSKAVKFMARSNITITSAGLSFYDLYFDLVGNTVSFLDNLTYSTSGSLVIYSGTIDFNDVNVSGGNIYFPSSTLARVLWLGNGVITLKSGTPLNSIPASNFTLYCEQSKIVISGTDAQIRCAGYTFYEVEVTSDGCTFYDSSTFNTITLNNAGGATGTKFRAGTTQNISNFSTNGSSGNLVKIRSSSTTNATLNYTGSGVVEEDYVDIDYITGTPDNTWYVGTNSTDGGHNSQIYFTDAPVTVNNSRSAKLTGQATTTDNRPAKITGKATTTNDRNAKLTGSVTTNNARSAKLSGIQTLTNDRSAKITGKLTTTDNRPAKITGNAIVTTDRDAKLSGIQTLTNDRPAKVTGFDTANDNRSVKIIGKETAFSTRNAKISGKTTAYNARTAIITGGVVSDTQRSAYLKGKDTSNDNRSAKVTGSALTNDYRNAKLTGVAQANDYRLAKITGYDTAQDTRNAHITGKETANDYRSATLKGIETLSNIRNARLVGCDTSDTNRGATIKGSDLANSVRSAKVVGILGANDTRNAKLTAQDTAQDTRTAKIQGSLFAQDTRPAKLTGGNTGTSSRSALIVGKGSWYAGQHKGWYNRDNKTIGEKQDEKWYKHLDV